MVRHDGLHLAQLLRAGKLTSVWVPDVEHEALRDLVRTKQTGKVNLKRARQALGGFLLRHGVHFSQGVRSARNSCGLRYPKPECSRRLS